MNVAIDPASDLVQFYSTVWNLSTATGFGLDNWGLILGVSRYLEVPNANEYFGFEGTPNSPFNVSPWYVGGSTSSAFALSDSQYRQLLLAKAQANLSSCSIQALNALAQAVFGDGAMFVVDLGGMAMEYVFASAPSVIDLAIAESSGVFPHPTGVATSVGTAVVNNAVLLAGNSGSTIGYAVGSYGSLTPPSDNNGNVINSCRNNAGSSFVLGIESAASLTASYFARLILNGTILVPSGGGFSFNFSAGLNTWTWTSGTLPSMTSGDSYALLIAT